MKTYWKATAPSGLDFYTGTVDYAAALESGRCLRVTGGVKPYHVCTADVLHASDVPTETLIGGPWPCRLFEVTGRPVASKGHKFGFRSLTVVAEVESWHVFGPQGGAVAALIERARALTPTEMRALTATGMRALTAARAAARTAARTAAGNAAEDAARATAGAAAGALVVRDLISTDHYNTLTLPWRTLIGPIHPGDPDAAGR